MSAGPVPKAGELYYYDFTTDVTKAIGAGVGYKDWGAGVALMVGADGTINNFDKLGIWNNHAGKKGYLNADFNMDSEVNNTDKIGYYLPNLDEAYSTQVPY